MTDRFLDNWTTQLRKGVLELAVLDVLGGRRLYGYELVKRLGEIEGLGIGEGTIYPILSRLARDGLVEPTLEESPEGPARKYHRLTGRGEEMLAEMQTRWRVIAGGIESIREASRG